MVRLHFASCSSSSSSSSSSSCWLEVSAVAKGAQRGGAARGLHGGTALRQGGGAPARQAVPKAATPRRPTPTSIEGAQQKARRWQVAGALQRAGASALQPLLLPRLRPRRLLALASCHPCSWRYQQLQAPRRSALATAMTMCQARRQRGLLGWRQGTSWLLVLRLCFGLASMRTAAATPGAPAAASQKHNNS